MYVFLCILEVLVAIGLIATVLLQSSKTAGLGSIAGGAETFFGKKRGIDQKLSRISTVLGVIFFVIPIILALI